MSAPDSGQDPFNLIDRRPAHVRAAEQPDPPPASREDVVRAIYAGQRRAAERFAAVAR